MPISLDSNTGNINAGSDGAETSGAEAADQQVASGQVEAVDDVHNSSFAWVTPMPASGQVRDVLNSSGCAA